VIGSPKVGHEVQAALEAATRSRNRPHDRIPMWKKNELRRRVRHSRGANGPQLEEMLNVE
jgi:hypothetical protein